MEGNLSVDLKVPFPTPRQAEIAHGTLSVDEEPRRGGVRRTLSLKGNILNVMFEASEARKLRVSVNSFMDHLILVTQTLDMFGPPS
ncbi:EKC/KEOPS complex subunit LAGE3-like [Haliotis cracherodii]|uniref:EKC/KEOPS complex subunit LAGE3-like n=1 Tax=Haliotis rufescens TaxID=6454 RepID=UPI001EB06936|nr:EKC/KEOPS complex subunit LAGE3-like [Haliotis rufescens]